MSLAQDPMTAQVTRLENQAWGRDCPRLMAGSQIALQAIRGGIKTTLSVSWETCMWVKKQQLEPDAE